MYEVVETISNPLGEPLEVWFEPWGMPHSLPPGQTFRVVAVSEQPGELEVEWGGSRVAVYAWPGATLRVYCGDRLVEDLFIKVPGLPPDTSTKSFVRFLFGGAEG